MTRDEAKALLAARGQALNQELASQRTEKANLERSALLDPVAREMEQVTIRIRKSMRRELGILRGRITRLRKITGGKS